MVDIVQYDNSCQILNEDDQKRVEALDLFLSFKIQGAEHSKAYKGYINQRGEEVTWDGRKHLLKSNLRFPVGLINKVGWFYKNRGVDVQIRDERKQVSDPSPIDISERLKEMDIVPRDYQHAATDRAVEVNRGIIRIATGGGKSLVAAMIAATLGKPTIIYVIGKDLLYQFHKFFSKVFDEEIGIIGDGKCKIHRINIATIWSVSKSLGIKCVTTDDETQTKEKEIDKDKFRDIKQMLMDSKLHLIDECHISSCETVQSISHHIKAEHFYGMSASPWRDDGSEMLIEAVLGQRVIDISAKYLIERGYLVPPMIRFLTVPQYETTGKKNHYKTVYKNYVTINVKRNEMITRAAIRLVEQGFRVLVLFHTKAHGKILHEMISKEIKCGILSGDDKSEKREKVCNQLESGEFECLIASKIFDIGVDLPSLSALVIAGGGKSSVRALQRVGRVIRLYEGKEIAPVVDFVDQAPYLIDHSKGRKEILSEEFEVQWPKEKQKQ